MWIKEFLISISVSILVLMEEALRHDYAVVSKPNHCSFQSLF